MNTSLLKLFNAVQVHEKKAHKTPSGLLERAVRNGYVLDPAIQATDSLLDTIEQVIGVSGEKANSAFHKSWTVVCDSSMEALVAQQMVHYITTYGFEALGYFQDSTVYIPAEVLELPVNLEGIPLTVVKAMDRAEIYEAVLKLAATVALADETLDDLEAVITGCKFSKSIVEKIGNRELKTRLSDHFGLTPTEPIEFLRHLVSKLTDQSLLIKNSALIRKIKAANGKFLDELLKSAPEDLASIFFRYKPLFLAMKTISRNKAFFNRLRKDATKLHKPLPQDYLNSVTSNIGKGKLDFAKLWTRLQTANVFRKIRLAYSLQYRLGWSGSTVYRVRNGRAWATNLPWDTLMENEGLLRQARDMVLKSIADDLQPNVEGQTFYIPANIHYALPATEKQYTGNFPTGTYVSVPEDLIFGIHWCDTTQRVDLDLSMVGTQGKLGWDGSYRSAKKSLLFSGDMTSAPAPMGASELFYARNVDFVPQILMVNYYNFRPGAEVDCKILVAKEKPEKFDSNYMVDPSNLVATANIHITMRQNVLGLVANVEGENRVYFANTSIGNAISSYNNTYTHHAREYFKTCAFQTLDFRSLLVQAGANVVDSIPGEGEYTNLAPEALDKSTLINLVQRQETHSLAVA